MKCKTRSTGETDETRMVICPNCIGAGLVNASICVYCSGKGKVDALRLALDILGIESGVSETDSDREKNEKGNTQASLRN
jgi:DnaJ-class molecular chaperone